MLVWDKAFIAFFYMSEYFRKRGAFMGKRSYDQLDFTDDFIFCKILTAKPNLCKGLLELILGVKIKKVEISESQKTINMTYDGKGVRLDVYVEDDKHTIYDIEMQTSVQKDLLKRFRYYQGMIDLNLIEKGCHYSELKETFIIFITTKKPFAGSNLPVYTFKSVCKENNSLVLDDKTTKIVINAEGDRSNLSKDMCDFLDFIQTGKGRNGLTKKLETAVQDAIHKKEWEVEYMTMAMKIQEAKIENEIELLKKLKFSSEQIVERLILDFSVSATTAQSFLQDYEANESEE